MADLPSTIGRFDIEMELGRGAMGCVYLAHDPKIDRKVAIKTIKANPGTSQAEANESRVRFLREAQAAGRLLHPGIVTIFDVGEEKGESYIAMEYIDGPTLEAATKPDNLLPVEKAVELVAQAAQALHFAHQHKIIHRDVKPANLMLVEDSKVKITDFGLAKNPSANLTSAGTLIGTPTYMSPEQIMGKDLDGRSDLFSLGVVLYELLTGDRPFGGETISTIIYKILHELPKRPDLVNPRVPAPLSKAILRALDKDPAKRFASCGEFGEALEEYLRTVRSAGGGPRSRRTAPPTELLVAEDSVASPPGPELELDEARTPTGSMAGSAGRAAESPLESRQTLRRPGAAVVPPRPRRRRQWPLVLVVLVLLLGGAATAAYMRPELLHQVGLEELAERLGLQVAGASAESGGEGAEEPAPPVGPSVSLPTPLPAGEVVTLDVSSDPPGARIYLDDEEVTGGAITLPQDDSASHLLVAESDCFVDSVRVDAAAPGPVVIPLKTPKVERVKITSDPPGAAVYVDGRSAGARTPAEIDLAACEPHTVQAKLDGYSDASRTLAEDADLSALGSLSLKLARLADGFVMVKGPYPLEVLKDGQRAGQSGKAISLRPGRHKLTLVNRNLFVSVPVEVDVEPEATVSPRVKLPGLGRMTVHANPSNGEVFVNDRSVGLPPILDLELAEGIYKVKYVLPSGQSDVQTKQVIEGQRVPVKFKLN